MTEKSQIDAAQGWRMILRRSAALLAGEASARFVGFLVVLLLARRLEPSAFGVVTLGLALVGWFSFVVDSGTEVLNVREVARRPARFTEIAEQVLGLRIALALASACVFVAGVELFAKSAYTRDTVVLFALLLPAIAVNLRWMALGVGGSRGIAAGNIAGRVVVLAGVLLLVDSEADVKTVPFLEAAGELAYGLIILAVAGHGLGKIRPRADLGVWRQMLGQSSPLMIGGVARATVSTFDVVLISLVLGPAAVGIYGVALRPALFAAGAVQLFTLSFLSAFSATLAAESVALHWRALRLAFLGAVVMAAALSAAAPLVPAVFGESYTDAVVVLAILAWRIPIVVLNGMYTTVLIAHDRQRTLMRNSVLAAVPIIAIDLVAILTFGLNGAAVASVVGVAMLFAVNYRSVVGYEPTLRIAPLSRRAPEGGGG